MAKKKKLNPGQTNGHPDDDNNDADDDFYDNVDDDVYG